MIIISQNSAYFTPKAGGFRNSLTSTSQEIGPLSAGQRYTITSSVNCWILSGATGGTAVVGDAAGNGSTFLPKDCPQPHTPVTGSLYLQFIKDTDEFDGFIFVSTA